MSTGSKDKVIVLVNVTEIVQNRDLDIVFPLGMLLLSNSLKKAGWKVTTHNIATKDIPGFVKGSTWEDVLFLGVCSVLTGRKIKAAMELSQAVKSFSKVPVVWGGLFPSSEPEMCLQKEYVDLIGIGEGEELIVDIARIYSGELKRENVPGVAYRDGSGKAVVTAQRALLEDLDRFSPDLSEITIDDYVLPFEGTHRILSYSILTSRGCPFDCAFCYYSAFNQRRWRKHSVDYVVNLIREIKKRGHFDYIALADDNPFVDKQRFFLIMERLFEIGIYISQFSLKLNRLEDDDLKRFAKLKVKSIFYGIESFQERVLKLCQKEHTRAMIVRANGLIRQNPSIKVWGGIVTVQPGETFEEIRSDIRESLDNIRFDGNLYINVVVFFPIPKTKFYQILEREGVFRIKDIDGWSRVSPYEAETNVRLLRPDASPRDVRLVIMAMRYTGKILNVARKFPLEGERRPVVHCLYGIANGIRWLLFSLAQWRLRREVFLFSKIDFLVMNLMRFVEISMKEHIVR